MPLLQRLIEPVYVCRNTLPVDNRGALAINIPNELECVTNGTLANVIRQLSSLSKHAEDIFATLFKESTAIAARAQSLQGRIDRLAVKVTQLDSNVEEVSLQDIHMRKAFRSTIVFDQQVVSRATMPAAMAEMYQNCSSAPPLDKLNPYRDDGKDGLKFYTDPNYFFDLWKQEMLKDTEKLIHDKGKKPHRPRPDGGKRHKKVRQPHNTREKYRMMASAQDFIDKSNYPPSNFSETRTPSLVSDGTDGIPVRPNSLELHMPYIEQDGSYGTPGNHYPPPPPAYTEYQSQAYPQQPMPQQQHYPPPPPYSVNSPDHRNSSNNGTPTRQSRTSSRPSQPPPAPPVGSNGMSTPPISTTGTPSSGAGRYRLGSHSRDTLPPPPPPPDVMGNGYPPNHMASIYLTQKPVPMVALTGNHNLQSSRRDSTPNHHSHLMNHARDQTPPPDSLSMTSDSLDLPPPPPMPEGMLQEIIANVPPSPPPPPLPSNNSSSAVLPPPPPPLPQGITSLGNRVSDLRLKEGGHGVSCESTSTASSCETDGKSRSPAQGDKRSDMLAAIREGIKLRRVEDIKQKEVDKTATLRDVASILARRVAMEFSDSDSASESEYDSDGWDEHDASEC